MKNSFEMSPEDAKSYEKNRVEGLQKKLIERAENLTDVDDLLDMSNKLFGYEGGSGEVVNNAEDEIRKTIVDFIKDKLNTSKKLEDAFVNLDVVGNPRKEIEEGGEE